MIVENGKYYLYRHIRLDKNEPFYIGISTKYPEDYLWNSYSRANKRAGRNSIWKRIIKKTDYKVEILLESNSRDFILEKEREFIKLYGRVNLKTGTLANLTDGGDYFDGFVDTEERRKKIGDVNRGKKKPKEISEKAWKTKRERMQVRGFFHSPDTREKMSEIRLGKKLTEESIRKREETRKRNSIKRGYDRPHEMYEFIGFKSRVTKHGIEKLLLIISLLNSDKKLSLREMGRLSGTDNQCIKRISKDKDFLMYFNQNYGKNKNS